MRPSVSAERLGVLFGLGLLALITFNVNSATRLFTWPWWVLWKLALFVPMVLWMAAVTRGAGAGCMRTAPAWLGMAFVGWYILAALASEHPSASISYATTMVALAATACTVAWHRRAPDQVPAVLGAMLVLYCAASLVAWWLWIAVPHWNDVTGRNSELGSAVYDTLAFGPRNSLLFGHWNYTAGLGVLALPWTVGLAWCSAGWRRLTWAAGVLVVFGAVVLAMSRGAWVGLAGAAGFAGLLWLAHARISRLHVTAGAAALVLVAALALLAIPRLRVTTIALFTGEGFTTSDVQRINMAAVGGMIVRDEPVLGQGPGLTPRLYPNFRHRVDGGVETAFQLHSTPLQLAADSGLPGMVLAAALVAFALVRCWRRIRERATHSPTYAMAGSALAGYSVYALTDYQLDVPLIAAAVAATLGLLFHSPAAPIATHRRLVVRLVCAGGGAMALLLIVVQWPEGRARQLLARGVGAVEAGQPVEVLDEAALRAADLLPDDPQPLVAAAIVHLRASQSQPDSGDAPKHRGAASHLLRLALAREESLEFAHFNLGWLDLTRDPTRSAAHFRRALALVPDRRGVYWGLALAHLERGNRERAVAAFGLELLHDPLMATSPAWDAPALRDLREPALDRAMGLADQLAARLPEPRKPAVRYVASLIAWLRHGTLPCMEGAPASAASLLACLHGRPAPAWDGFRSSTSAWRVLMEASGDPAEWTHLLRQWWQVYLGGETTSADVAAAARLLETHGTDWRGWVLAPEGREAPFVHLERSHRPAYATLAYNLDIPTPYDEFLCQQNRIARCLLQDLLPAKGHLPATAVLRLVAELDL